MNIQPYTLIAASLVFGLLPIIATTCTAYIKVSIVTGMLKNCFGVNSLPGMTAEFALNCIVTVLVMFPVYTNISGKLGNITAQELESGDYKALSGKILFALEPLKKFFHENAGVKEIRYFEDKFHVQNNNDQGKDVELPFKVLLPSFLLTEIKNAFRISFILLFPFMLLDIVISVLLTGMGMFMVSPTVISLPLKMFLFIITDGWLLLLDSLVNSYKG